MIAAYRPVLNDGNAPHTSNAPVGYADIENQRIYWPALGLFTACLSLFVQKYNSTHSPSLLAGDYVGFACITVPLNGVPSLCPNVSDHMPRPGFIYSEKSSNEVTHQIRLHVQ